MKPPKQPAPPPEVRPVPGPGWCVVARLKGPLPELHRGRYHGEGHKRQFLTYCDVAGRHVADIPEGTNAVLCPTCLLMKR